MSDRVNDAPEDPQDEDTLLIATLDDDDMEQLNAELEAAVAHHQAGRLDDAEAGYNRVLNIHPCNPAALNFLGVVAQMRGERKEAERLIGRAIAFKPDYAQAYNNLGRVFFEQNEYLQAGICFQRSLHLDPDDLIALQNLAPVLHMLSQFDAAIDIGKQILEDDPDSVVGNQVVGTSYMRSGRFEESLPFLRKTNELKPDDKSRYNLGMALHASYHEDEAREIFTQWSASDPKNPIAQHMAAAYAGSGSPSRASDAYVRGIFDDFASSFDVVLKRLQYQVPRIIAGTMPELYDEAKSQLDILDAGCGTGLCGKGLKPYARTLIGVDLSVKMLELAHKLDLYDDLIEAELTAFLGAQDDCFDLVVSGDTLCYFGELTDAINASAGALRSGGKLVFTVERSAGEDFQLNQNGRYSHSGDYVSTTLVDAGFEGIELTELHLRTELSEPVEGYLVVATKP